MKYDLDQCALRTINLLITGMKKSDLVGTFLTSLVEFSYNQENDENYIEVEDERVSIVYEKTRYEILCFASYWTSTLIIDYLTTKSLFQKKVDIEGAQYFYKNIKKHLNEMCRLCDFDKLNDLDIKSINPTIHVGQTDRLNSDKRLNEYENAAKNGKNSDTLKIYSKHLAMTFALEKYIIYEPLTYTFSEPTIMLSRIVMRDIFENQII